MDIKSTLRRLAVLTIADGLLSLGGGRSYARLWRALPGPSWHRHSAAWFTGLPPWLLRLAGIGEVALGLALLHAVRDGVKEVYQHWGSSYGTFSRIWRWRLLPAPQRTFDVAMVLRKAAPQERQSLPALSQAS